MADLVGQNIIVELLGQDGMATVFRAYNALLDRGIAIKVIDKRVIKPDIEQKILKHFGREVKFLAKIELRDILNIHDKRRGIFKFAIAMEYKPGGTFKKFTGSTMPYQEADNNEF